MMHNSTIRIVPPLLTFELFPQPGFVIGQRAQIQSITDVSRGSIKRKKMSSAYANSLNALCIPEDEVAPATKQPVVTNHDAIAPSIYHAILSRIIIHS